MLYPGSGRYFRKNHGGTYAGILKETWVAFISPCWMMDDFEGIHVVCISSSPSAVSTPTPGYKLLMTGSKGIAVYSSHAFYEKKVFSGLSKQSRAKKVECPVGKYVLANP